QSICPSATRRPPRNARIPLDGASDSGGRIGLFRAHGRVASQRKEPPAAATRPRPGGVPSSAGPSRSCDAARSGRRKQTVPDLTRCRMGRRKSARGGARPGSGRPRKPVAERERHSVTAKLTDSELEDLREIAEAEPLGKLLRRLVLRYLVQRRL